MAKNTALIVAGIIFVLAALVHLVRLFNHFQIVVGNHEIPSSASGIGLVIAIILAIWMFAAARSKHK